MESQEANADTEQLLAEREEILRQLAELGELSSDSDNELEVEKTTETEQFGDKTPSANEKTDAENISKSDDDEEKPERESIQVVKTVLERNDFDKSVHLPDGWTCIAHQSGMMVYYHKFTRVVTHSRPYCVEGIIREHEIPISSIPCYYRLVMDEKYQELEKQKEETENVQKEIDKNEPKLTPTQFREYCSKRFKFKEITVNRFTNPSDKNEIREDRKVNSMLKRAGFDMNYDQLKKKNQPGDVLLSSPSGAVLIDLTPVDHQNRITGPKRPYLLNPMGKTTVTVLNEFAQRLVKGTLTYEMEDTRNVSCPYKATATLTMNQNALKELAGQCRESLTVLCEIAAMTATTTAASLETKRFAIGRGVGANKKTARLVAAKDALSKLIPKLRVSEEHICDGVLDEQDRKGFEEESRELFKKVRIDSQSLVQMCTRFAIPKPYGLLKDAVSRSMRWNGMELEMTKELVGNGGQTSKVTLKLGEMQQSAEAIGVKQATQYASQLLFMKMHPELTTYGSFLEMYGRHDDKFKMDNAKKQHDEVVRLQDTGNLLEPNFIVLSKLAEEMKKVAIVHPPRKYLFGLAPNSSGTDARKKSVSTQCTLEDSPAPVAQAPLPLPPPPPMPFFGLPMPPIAPILIAQPFVGQLPYYPSTQQSPTTTDPIQGGRKRQRTSEHFSPPFPPPPPPPKL